MDIEVQPVQSPDISIFVDGADTARPDKLEELYEYRNSDEVTPYLQSYPTLFDFLQESYRHLLKQLILVLNSHEFLLGGLFKACPSITIESRGAGATRSFSKSCHE